MPRYIPSAFFDMTLDDRLAHSMMAVNLADDIDDQSSVASRDTGKAQAGFESAPVFKHKPLPKGPLIRLIELKNGRRNTAIECTIVHRRLEYVTGTYDALSYVWGSDQNLHWIYINDQRFAIRENLYHFLVELRSSVGSMTLWADALCIKQDDLIEKNHQVQQMSSVYRNSRLTRIWLGERSQYPSKGLNPSQADFLSFFLTFSNAGIRDDSPATSIRSTSRSRARSESPSQSILHTICPFDFGEEDFDLLSNMDWDTIFPNHGLPDYIQNNEVEVEAQAEGRAQLAERDSYQHNTQLVYDPRTDERERQATASFSSSCNKMVQAKYWNRLWIVQEVLLSRKLQIHVSDRTYDFGELVRVCKNDRATLAGSAMLTLYQQRLSREYRTLPELIQAHQSRLCSDVRDRVFGLLGLVNDFVIDVDYESSRRALFEKVLRNYPAQFANVLALPLASALDITSENAATILESTKAVLRAKECGALIEGRNALAWNYRADQVLQFHTPGAGAFLPGDKVVTLVSDFDASISTQACFVIILRRQRPPAPELDMQGKAKRICYDVIGSATTYSNRNAEASPALAELEVRSLQACRNIESHGYGPISIYMSVEEFLKMDAAGAFSQVQERLQVFDGIVCGLESTQSRSVLRGPAHDSDEDEKDWGILV